jgi:hypothetical protein
MSLSIEARIVERKDGSQWVVLKLGTRVPSAVRYVRCVKEAPNEANHRKTP